MAAANCKDHPHLFLNTYIELPTSQTSKLGGNIEQAKIQKEFEREDLRKTMGDTGTLAGREQGRHGVQDTREGVKNLGGMT